MYPCPECDKSFDLDNVPEKDQVVFCPYCNNAIIFVDTLNITKDSIVGGFRIIEKIGQGGMGSVYLAEQVSMKRKVALKILDEDMIQDKDAVNQFMKEVKTTALLEHPAIVKAIDAGVDHETYYFAMTYVEGTDLETYLETKGRLTEIRALKYVIRIAEALKYAWDSHRLLHRDIKPGNIMIDSDDEPFLLDMGIAQHFSESFEKQDLVDGSPYYMSPEQTFAEPLSWSSDLYSLGATLYHLVVGVPPYDDEEIEKIVEMHSACPFPEPLEKNPKAEISQATVELMRNMMAKKPEYRFDSWEEFISVAKSMLKELSCGREPEPIKDRTEENERTKKLTPSNPWITTATFFSVFIALVLSVIFVLKGIAERRASRDLFNAERYILSDNFSHEKAVEVYGQAIGSCSSLFVSHLKLERAQKGFQQAKESLQQELTRRSDFKKAIQDINLIIQNIDQTSPANAVKQCNKAGQMLIKLSPQRESEYDKYQKLGKKIHIIKLINENKLNKK